MIYLYGQDEIVRAWASQKLGYPMTTAKTIGIWSPIRERLVGAYLFTQYTGAGVEITIAGRCCYMRAPLREAVRYGVDQLGVVRCVTHTPCGSKKHPRKEGGMARRLGFRFEGKCRNFYGSGKDALQWAFTIDDVILLGLYAPPASQTNEAA